MKDSRITNSLLIIIVIPLVFYLLKILSFIFIPLIMSMFIALLFLPIMRWMNKKKVPKSISVLVVVLIISGLFKGGVELIQLATKEIIHSESMFFEKAEIKLLALVVYFEQFLGIERMQGDNVLVHYLNKDNFIKNFGSTLDFIGNTISMTLMTVFFVVLWLVESINFQNILNDTILKQKYSSIKVFAKIEKDILKFIKVKFIISFLTGLSFSLACIFFDVSFPIFWGLFAFAINFIQMIGSVISVVFLSLFAFVELDPTGFLLFFIITIILIQVLFGSILEPIFMGKTFSVSVITILVMLMLWGYIWGVPGLIMSIPITVFVNIILEQFPKMKVLSSIIAGSYKKE